MKKIIYLIPLVLVFYATPNKAQVNLQQGLVGKYKFDNGSIADSLNNMSWFSGMNQTKVLDRHQNTNGAIHIVRSFMPYIPSPDVLKMPAGNSPRSLSIWFKLYNLPSSGLNNLNFLYFHGNPFAGQGFGLALGQNQIYFIGYNDDLIANVAIPINQWAHLAATYDGSVAKLYLNGVLVAQANKSWNTPASNAKLGYFNTSTISHGNSSTTVYNNYFNGDMDDFSIYSRALSPQEIMALSNQTLTSISENVDSEHSQLLLYPNPVTADMLHIDRGCKSCVSTMVNIYNQQGALMKSIESKMSKQIEINVSDLAKGMYLLRLPESSKSQAFIVE